MIRIQNGNHDQSGQTGSKAAVIQNEAAVHTCGGRAYDRVDQSGKEAFFPSVSTCDGAETGGEGDTVDIYLRGKHPRKRFTEERVYDTNENRQRNVTKHDGGNVSRVLTVSGERQCREERADRGTGEACSDRKTDLREDHTKKFRCEKDDVQISKCAKSVKAEIDETDGHTEFGREIKSVARAFEQSTISVEGFSVHNKAQHNGSEEDDEEKDIHEYDVGIVEGIVYGIIADDDVRRGKSEGAVQERVRADAENTDGESCLVHIISSLDGGDTGKQSGYDKSRQRTEYDRKDHAEPAELDRTEMKLTDGIAEQKVADERRERGREHGDMQIFTDRRFSDQTVNKDTDEGRPHIQKIKSVKAMCDDENICCEGFCVGFCLGDEDHQIAGKTAQTCVEQCACQTTQVKVVSYQFGWRSQDAEKISPECVVFFGVVQCEGNCRKQGKAQKQCKQSKRFAVFFVFLGEK